MFDIISSRVTSDASRILYLGLLLFTLSALGCDDEPQGPLSQGGAGLSQGGASDEPPLGGEPPMAGELPTGGETPAGGETPVGGGAPLGGEAPMGGEEPRGGEEPTGGVPLPAPEAVCEGSVPLTCDTGTLFVSASQARAQIQNYSCGDGFSYPGRELVFEFLEARPRQVSVSFRPVELQYSVSYILFALEGDPNSCDLSTATCHSQRDTLVAGPLEFDYRPEDPLRFVIDPRLVADAQMDFEVAVRCDALRCGDGVLNDGESCDDGNLITGDGCDAQCQVEDDYRCEGEPSVCQLQVIEGECPTRQSAGEGVYVGDTRACVDALSTISGGCGNATDSYGPEASYLVSVPAGEQLIARLETPEGSGLGLPKLWVALDPQAPSESCVQASSEAFAWLNGGAEPREVLVIVDGSRSYDRGEYELSLDFAPPPSEVGSSCLNPIEINASGTFQGETQGLLDVGNPHGGVGGRCVREGGFWGYNGGPDDVYHVRLEPGQELSVSAQATGAWDHVVSIHSDCADLELACLVWDDFGSASVLNDGVSSQDYYIVIGGFYSYSMGAYTLQVELN